jgi:hypothetical protein
MVQVCDRKVRLDSHPIESNTRDEGAPSFSVTFLNILLILFVRRRSGFDNNNGIHDASIPIRNILRFYVVIAIAGSNFQGYDFLESGGESVQKPLESGLQSVGG